MKIQLFLGLVTLFIGQTSGFSQASLAPSGSPEPSMRSLLQIQPRFPISTSPTNLTLSGSYYLTTNLTVPAFSSAITISADNVSLDLCGFTLTGLSNSFGAIVISANRVTVFNGIIRNCNFNYGVDSFGFDGCSFEGLNLVSNVYGIRTGSRSIVKNCIASQNTFAGILCQDGNSVTGNLCDRNGNSGIYLTGAGNRIDNNHIVSNSFYGIFAANGASNNLIIHNSFMGGGQFISSGPNWIIGPVINGSSIATNTHPHANFNLN